MCDSFRPDGFSRRQFNKNCLLGLGGFLIGADYLKTFRPEICTGLPSVIPADDPGKFSKEALFYSQTSKGIQCLKCPHYCLLAANESGRCRNRVNLKGKLYSIAYGNPCAVHIDPIEKKPLFHFLPTTRAFSIAAAGCNFRCLNCQNWQISQVSPNETDNADMMPGVVVDQCAKNRCESIAYTYSEPTSFFEYVLDTAKLARSKKIKNVLKSNGYINEEPLRSLSKYLDAANIDLKCYDDTLYAKLSGGKLEPVLKTLKVLKEEGVWLEITNLVIPSWTDDLNMIKKMCEWMVKNGLYECPLHFTRFTPLYKLTQLPLTPVSILEKARDTAMSAGMHYVFIGNVPGHASENTYCFRCRKLIIERKGFSIMQNFVANGTCKLCGEKIPGVWK